MNHFIHRISNEYQYSPSLMYDDATPKKNWIDRMGLSERNEWAKERIRKEAEQFRKITSKWESRPAPKEGGMIEKTGQIPNGKTEPS